MTRSDGGDLRPPSIEADEKTTLVTFLDYLREAVVAKVAGVDESAGRTPGVDSGTSLLWLLKHLIAVEHNWFVWTYDGAETELWDDDALPSDGDTVDSLIAEYREIVRRANEIIEACDDLGRPGARSLRETAPATLRWVLVHLIEETARHAGHADILREQIDGAVGR